MFEFEWITMIGCIMVIIGLIWLIGRHIGLFFEAPDVLNSILTVFSIVLLIVGCLFISVVITPSDEIRLYDSVGIQGINVDNSTVYYGESFITKNGDLLHEGDVCVILIGDGVWCSRGLPKESTFILKNDGLPCVKTYECYWNVSLLGLTPSFQISRSDCVYEVCVPENSGNEVIPYVNDNYRYREPLKHVEEGSYLISELF